MSQLCEYRMIICACFRAIYCERIKLNFQSSKAFFEATLWTHERFQVSVEAAQVILVCSLW